jgi:hypothetical protein
LTTGWSEAVAIAVNGLMIRQTRGRLRRSGFNDRLDIVIGRMAADADWDRVVNSET